MDRHYIGSVTATTHQKKGIITLESNPSRGTACKSNLKLQLNLSMHVDLGENGWTDGEPDGGRVSTLMPINYSLPVYLYINLLFQIITSL